MDRLKVLCLTTLPSQGAGNRLRVEQYAAPLHAAGIDLVVSPFFDEATYRILYRGDRLPERILGTLRGIGRRLRDVARCRDFRLVLVYRESAPLGPPLFEGWLERMGVPYAYDVDDAVFLGPVHPSNRRWAWLRHPSRYESSARGARTIITANEYLAAWARRLSNDVSVIPTPVDTSLFRPIRDRHTSGPLVIGWIGSSTTAPYLRLLDDVLDRIAGRVDFVLRVIGGRYSHPRARVELLPWSLEREPADVGAFDIGVLPQPDDPWTRGKSAFKALLYMSAAVPVIASDVGVNPHVIPEGLAGHCVRDTDGWVAAIERLAGDPDLRSRFGAHGREWVEARYSLSALAPRFADALRRAAT